MCHEKKKNAKCYGNFKKKLKIFPVPYLASSS